MRIPSSLASTSKVQASVCLLSLSSILLFLPACTHTTQVQLDQKLATWLGLHPDALVEQWGAPGSSYTMENGKKVLSYQDVAIMSRTMSYGSFVRPDIYSFSDSCKINFFTDSSQKKIEAAKTSGSPSVCLDMVETVRRMPAKP